MSNLVLYRKYRPKNFSEVVGQEHIVTTLSNALENDMVSHSYLFCGPRGSGKTTIARILAKAVNCLDRKGAEPCNKCSACLEINSNRAIDLIEIDAASNRGIDEIRQLKEGARFSPTRLKYKVYIIDEAHQLSKDAANALLKILEEPPAHVIFILATTDAHKMIPTIISRCQRFDFYKLTVPQIVEKLKTIAKAEKTKIDDDALELIAANSEGAFRDAEGLLDQVITFAQSINDKHITAEEIKDFLGIIDSKLISEFFDLLIKKDRAKAIGFFNENVEKGINPFEFAKNLIDYIRYGLLFKIDPDLNNSLTNTLTSEDRQKIEKQMAKIEEKELRTFLKVFLEAQARMKYSPIPQLPIELAILEITDKKE